MITSARFFIRVDRIARGPNKGLRYATDFGRREELETWLHDDRANYGAIYYRETVICRLPRRIGRAINKRRGWSSNPRSAMRFTLDALQAGEVR